MNDGRDLAKVLWYYDICGNVASGSQKIICPFHADINPSMVVNFDDGSWFCFGCNCSGDAMKFVRLMEHKLNDLQACRKYWQILRSDKASDVKVVKRTIRQAEATSKELYAQAYDYYHGLAHVKWCTPEEQEALEAKEYLEQRGFNSRVLERCGAKITYNKHYSVIFPIRDNGKFKGWVCRTTLKEVEAQRKYLYNTGFKRATTVVGDYGKKDSVIVVEGFMDRLKFIQYGENNVVALFGWKASQQQIEKLKKAGIKYIISALDNDECGRKGTAWLRQHFKVVEWQYLCGVKDPGDMCANQFKRMYKKTMEGFENGFTR